MGRVHGDSSLESQVELTDLKMAKQNSQVTSSARKQRKNHFQAASHQKRKVMSASLSRELRAKYNVRSMPVVKDDEAKIVRGQHRSAQTGKIIQVYRKKNFVHIEESKKKKLMVKMSI